MQRYNNYSIDNSYPKRPTMKSVLIMVPVFLFLFLLLAGVYFYTMLSNKIWAALLEMTVFFLNILYLEYFYTRNLCMERMDMLREETRLGDVAGNLYQADVMASFFFTWIVLFFAAGFVINGIEVPAILYGAGLLPALVYSIPVIREVRSLREKCVGIFKIVVFGTLANVGCIMMLYILGKSVRVS